jgi:alkylation response protein AidB-like acyl-CoA dehydrogenase
MNFELDADQQALLRATEDFVRSGYTLERRRANIALAYGERSPSWQEFAELGLLGLLVPESHGGIGRTMVDAGIVMEQLGRALVAEPFIPSAIVATTCIQHAEQESAKAHLLPALASGTISAALVSASLPCAPADDAAAAFEAEPQADGGWRVKGRHAVAAGADNADVLVVDARGFGVPLGRALLWIERNAPGVNIAPYRNHDGTRGAAVTLDECLVPAQQVLALDARATTLVDRAQGNGIAAVCAEAVGAMSAALELTLEYLRTRQQFGATLASFQTLKHRAVDMLMALERARSMAHVACIAADQEWSQRRHAQLSAAKVQIAQSARFVGQQAVQLHGGIGMTDEYAAGHYLRRLMAIEQAFGDMDHHVSVLCHAGGVPGLA